MKTNRIFPLACITLLWAFIPIFSLTGQSGNLSQEPGYGEATYAGFPDDEFLKNWLVIGPIPVDNLHNRPDDRMQKQFFDNDLLTAVQKTRKSFPPVILENKTYSWKPFRSVDGNVNFDQIFGPRNYAVSYAMCEIRMNAPEKVLIGVGSDDGIKVFLNGKLVLSNWIHRKALPDEDLVTLDLQKGSNQLLVKIQNIEDSWSFNLHKPGRQAEENLLVKSAGNGNLDFVRLLIGNGVDPDSKNAIGLTAYQYATVTGREKVKNYLLEKGARTDLPMPSFVKLADGLFLDVVTGQMPGVSVLVSKDGEVIYAKGFGFADIEKKLPVTPDTKFRIGSITKQFTAAAILKLQEEGKLHVTDKLSKFLPDFPRASEVTLYQLLTHTAGIHGYADHPSIMENMAEPVSARQVIDTIGLHPYDANPGDRYVYNNSGFFLLGYVTEIVTGKKLGAYLEETFFKPLGMDNTGIVQNNVQMKQAACGYAVEKGTITKAPELDMSWLRGAGDMYSTTKDLNTWNEALYNGKVLSTTSLKSALTPAVLNNGQTVEYGFGLNFLTYRGIHFITHGGVLPGFRSILVRQPENRITVVVLCNSSPSPAGIDPNSNSSALCDFLLWQKMGTQESQQVDRKVDENILKKYVGRFDYGQGKVLIISQEDGQLYAQLTGQPKFPIYPSSDREFYWKVVDAHIDFVTDDKGNVSRVIHHQNGQQFEARKLEDEIPVRINSAIFDRLVGQYDLGDHNIITVTKEGKELFVQGMNLPKYQLLPASAMEYFTREINIRITFRIGSGGKAQTALILLNGVSYAAKRTGP